MTTFHRISKCAIGALMLMALAPAVDAAPKKKSRAAKPTASRGTTVNRLPKWDQVPASSVRLQRGKLLVGLTDGGAAFYNEATGVAVNVIRGNGAGSASEVLWEGQQAWWFSTTTGRLFFASATQRTPGEVDLSASGMNEPVRRISLWQGKVLVQGRAQIRVVDPATKRVMRPEEYFPADVAAAIQQGTIMSSWHSRQSGAGEGQLVVIRRYARRAADQPGKRESAAITAWHSTGRNYRWLSTYVRPLVDFVEAPGPRVSYTLHKRKIDEPFAYCETGNLQMNEDGVIALDNNVLLTVPVRTTSWVPDEIPVRVDPKYAQSISSSSNNAWWTDGQRLFCASIENGATDVYVGGASSARITDLAADDEGVWVVRGQRLARILATNEGANGFSGYVRYAALDEKLDMNEGESNLRSKARVAGPMATWELVNQSLAAAGYSGTRLTTLGDVRSSGRRIRGELMIGDVLSTGGEPAVFIGNGEVARVRVGRLVTEPLTWNATTEAYRMLDISRMSAFRPGAKGPLDEDPFVRPPVAGRMAQRVPYFGLGKPNYNLGHDMFVSLNIGGRYDKPWLPVHDQMRQEGLSWFGTRYVWGGTSRNGVDCSGFVQNVFRAVGVNIPRTSATMGQTSMGRVVTDDLRFGDVLVYPGHVALYVGNGKTFETVRGKGVSSSNIWRRDRAIVRRFIER
jgi:hypothetical protein